MCNFHIGQKVVCISDCSEGPDGHTVLGPVDLPHKGHVYTVRECMVGACGKRPCILLEEIPDQWVPVMVSGDLLFGNVVFEANKFRPVVERKTDISCFKAMLNQSKQTVEA